MTEAVAQSTLITNTLTTRQRPAEGLWRDAFRRLRRTRLAFASGLLLLALVIVAIFAPVVAPKPYDLQDYDALTQEPGSSYWLGTDDLGRDVLSRLIFGARISLAVGVGLVNWMPAARLVRAQVVSLKEKEFVEAARGIGASDRRIMAQHLLPNVVATIVVTATLGIPQAIIYEAGISFLGLGARPPMPSWGLMIAEALDSLRSYPYLLVSPAIALSLTVLAFNFLGDGPRDALDPWMRR